MQEFGGAVSMRQNDHLGRSVTVAVDVCGALKPARMAGEHLVTAAFERRELVDLVQVVDNRAIRFGKMQIVLG